MVDIDEFWEYSDPEGSEERFRKALEDASGDERLEIQTQIGRTYSLRNKFDEAHQILDDVERELATAGSAPRVRYLLERGRTHNSSGEKESARALFLEAWEVGKNAGLEGLAVDAAHMVAITYAGEPEGIRWNQRGLEIARESDAPKAKSLIPAMLNNNAWDLHDMERYADALPYFEEALAEWSKRGKRPQIQIAKWSLARCLRSLKRNDEALQILFELEGEHEAMNTADGYVFEEIAENLEVLGKEDAGRYFRKAFVELSEDEWFVAHEPERLAGIEARAVNE